MPPGSNSALQVACGRLIAPVAQDQQRVESKVHQSLLTGGVRLSRQHAAWLRDKNSRTKQNLSSSKSASLSISSKYKSRDHHESSVSKSSLSTEDRFLGHMKGSMLENDLDIPSKSLVEDWKGTTVRSKRSSQNSKLLAEQLSTYEGSLASHLHTETKDTSANPFRMKERDSKIHLSAAKSLSTLHNRQVDPKTYSNDSITTNYGKYAVSVKEPYVTGVPSVDKVNKALVQLSRRMIVCYDTKVVETGAALKVDLD